MKEADVKIILSKRLRELTEEKRDLNYRLSDKKQAELMGISYNTFRNYLDGKSDCPASNLTLMSKFYGVTTDYLLGMTNNPSIDGDERKFCDMSGLSEKSANTLFANLHTGTFNKMFEFSFFEDLLSVIEDVDEESRIWLADAKKNDLISKIELDSIDTYRYRAHKLFDDLLDDFDQRSYNKELTEQINTKTNEYKGKIENEIGRLKVLYFSTSDEEERQKLLKQISDLRHK